MTPQISPLLQIQNLHVAVQAGTGQPDAGKEVLRGLNLLVNAGETHVLLGINGSGKSTLAYAIAGHPRYTITEGRVELNGRDLREMTPDERARAGLFLAFQHPLAVPGVSVANFLRMAYQARFHGEGSSKPFSVMEFQKKLMATMQELQIDLQLAMRNLNDGFSGGEKKQIEVLQLALLQPRIAILDETDSGLDSDKLSLLGTKIERLAREHQMAILIITHYRRMLDYVPAQHVHLLMDGKIVTSGGPELAREIENTGYETARHRYQAQATA